MDSIPQDQQRNPAVAAYYGVMLASSGEKGKAREYLEIGKTATLLPEEKVLVERAELSAN
jgi:hypothetical protein